MPIKKRKDGRKLREIRWIASQSFGLWVIATLVPLAFFGPESTEGLATLHLVLGATAIVAWRVLRKDYEWPMIDIICVMALLGGAFGGGWHDGLIALAGMSAIIIWDLTREPSVLRSVFR